VIERALAAVIERHAAFRLRFTFVDEVWRQSVASATGFRSLEVTGTAGVDDEVRRLQLQLDVTEGPLVCARILTADSQRRLLIGAHHLAVDAVSWRIIVSDLATACEQMAEGRAASFASVTRSYPEWLRERSRRMAAAAGETTAQRPDSDRDRGVFGEMRSV